VSVFHQAGQELGPNGLPLRSLQDLIEEGDREQRKRQQALRSQQADATAFVRFAGRQQPVGHDDLVAEVVERGTAVEFDDEIDLRRCRAELDRWRADGGNFHQLRDALGTRAQATRAAMLDSQYKLRARFEEVERTKSALEREVDRLRREVASLRGDQDHVWEVMAEHGGYH
jgi:hypothetical protein